MILLFVREYLHENRPTLNIEDVAKSMPFYYVFFVGTKDKELILPVGKGLSIWSDCRYTFVVSKDDKPFALIGFDIEGDELRIEQLQGIKGVNMKGENFALRLIQYAEEFALALGLKVVMVKSAHSNFYYELDDQHKLYPVLYKHQDRLGRIYNQAPKLMGYYFCGDWSIKYLDTKTVT